jgi:Fic family protein
MEFYTRISTVENGLNVTRKTASNYLNELVETGILVTEVRGKDKLFINKKLLDVMKKI